MRRSAWRERRGERGVSLIEVAVAVGLMSVVIGTIGVVVNRPQQLMQSATDKLVEGTQTDVALQELTRMLGQSHVMKTGLLMCGGNTIPPDRGDADTTLGIALGADGDRFSFAYSGYSSLVAISATTAGQVLAMDAAKFPRGSLILLTHINDPTFGGLFNVVDSNPANGTLTLELSTGKAPAPIPCQAVPGVGKGLGVLATDPFHQVFNQNPTTFRADRIHYASYSLSARPTEPDRYNIMLNLWPRPKPGAGTMLTQVAVERAVTMSVDLNWKADGSGNGGNVVANFKIRREELLPSKKARGARDLAGTATYPLGGSLRRNFGAPVIPDGVAKIFPTCALVARPIRGIFRRDTDPTQPLFLFEVSGLTSSLGGVPGSISATFSGNPTNPTCWASNATGQIDTTGPTALVVGVGMTNGFALTPGGGSGGFEPVYCDLPAGAQITGDLSYYDAPTQSVAKVPCTPVTSPFSGTFKYVGAPSSCNKANGVIRFGRLEDTDTKQPGPMLFVDDTSCEWDDNPGNFTSCSQVDAAGKLINPNRQLLSVHLRPAPLDIKSASTEVACN